MDPTDLSGMDSHSAREYVHQFLTSLRFTQHQHEKLEALRQTWEDRVRLANERDRADLVAPARERLAEVQTQIGALSAEASELEPQLDVMRAQLRRLSTRPEMTVNAEQLLAELNALVGERDELGEDFEQLEHQTRTEDQLRELKGRLGSDSSES